MAYSSDYQRQLFERDCKLLIRAVTKFEENEENFKICLDFMLSNLLYHSYLDVNSHKAKHSIKGLYEKFLIFSDLEKANSFKSVTDKVLEIFDRKFGSEKENAYSIIALLLHLSESDCSSQPVSRSVSSFSDTLDNEEKSLIDWGIYLREGDDKYILSDSSSEVFSSDEDSVDEIDNEFLRLPPRDDSGLGISPDSCSGGSQQQFHLNSNCVPSVQDDLIKSPDSVKENLFYSYWISKHQLCFTSNPYNLMNFTKAWEEHIASEDSLTSIVKKVLMHERNVVKEILWMLSGVKDLFLFQWDGYEFIVNPVVHLCNLTSNTLGSSLKEFCDYGTKGVFLRSFVEEALLEDPCAPNFCLTFHTYVGELQKQLQKVNDSFCSLEKRLRVRRETFTVLNFLETCKSILYDLDTIYYVNHDVLESIPINCDPFEKACRLLHVLWKRLIHFSLRDQASSSIKITLTLFLQTCKPFFNFLESLIIHGSFKDIHEEFICSRKEGILVTDSEFWEHGLILKDLPSDIQEEFFLKSFFKDIIIAGKSIEIFNKMNYLMKVEPFRLHVEKGELYSKFIHILYKLINKRHPENHDYSDDIFEESVHVLNDPLLEQPIFSYQSSIEKFFRPSINPVYVPIVKNPLEKLFTERQVFTEKSKEALEPKSLKPLNVNIIKAFDNCMKYAYYPTCRRLVKALNEKYSLLTHMNIMQKYYLMESGDLMFSFYSKVFEKIFYNEPWQDVSFLYSVLQNAIAEDKENCESLCVFLDASNSEVQKSQPLSQLNALQLSYEVEWPVSIMLGSSIQNQYCQIFSFLLQIKAAKYLLDGLHFIRLYDNRKEPPSKLTNLLSKSVFPKKQKIHGMYIIRMRLMYFVNGLHNYIMARILHSFGLEFNVILQNARTVDDMIVAHNSYLKSLHERCFLDRRLPHLREQIFQVLNLCYSFQQLWLKGVDSISLEELENIEIQFSKYNSFLFSYFNTPLRRGVYIHLESLVSSMLSETHDLHLFKPKKGMASSSSYDKIKRYEGNSFLIQDRLIGAIAEFRPVTNLTILHGK